MKTIHSLMMALAVTAPMTLPATALADPAHHPSAPTNTAQIAAATAADATDAEVRKVDVEQGKLTLKHGEIKHLDMPPMTMVFHVKDKAMLQGLKTGDKVRVKIANADGRFTVTEIAPATR